VTGFEVEVFDFAALQLEAAGSLRDEAGSTDSEHWRSAWLHVTDFQLGFGDAELDGSAGLALAVIDVARAIVWIDEVATTHVARTGGTVTAVQFDSQITESVNAYADSTLGVTRGEITQKTLCPVFLVSAAVLVVAVEVVVLQRFGEFCVFNETFGFCLVTNKRGGRSQLSAGCCCNCQCDCAPLHHAHRDLLLWF